MPPKGRGLLLPVKKTIAKPKKATRKTIVKPPKNAKKTTVRPKAAAASQKKNAASPRPKNVASSKRQANASPSSPSTSKALQDVPAKVQPRMTYDGAKVAKEVLRLAETGKHDAILRVLGDDVGPGTGAVVARKAFLRISMLIHPDKLPDLPEATKAFQALVVAFDMTQTGGARVEPEKPRHATLARSNDGCFRTEVLCPRCEAPWGRKVDGNPDYFYNFMMEGLKCVTCSTCLLKFGCLTAIHICPFCRSPFEYYPDQYHRHVSCGNPCCDRRFGFMCFHASERALKAAREQVRADFEAEVRRREQVSERAKRLAQRLQRFGGEVDAETCFSYGLRDVCPRCGLDFSTEKDDGAQLRHLRTCNDAEAQKAHRHREEQRSAAKLATTRKAQAQHNAAADAVFNFCGGGPGQLWMLDAEQLRRLCDKEGVANNGSLEVMIERLAEHFAKTRGQMPQLTDLPRNLHSLSDAKIKAVCAAFRLKGLSSRGDRLDAIEDLMIEGVPEVAPKAITGQSNALAIKDKAYLRKQGQRVLPTQAAPKHGSTAKAEIASKASSLLKRRRAVAE